MQRYNKGMKVSSDGERMWPISVLTVFVEVLQCHQKPIKSQEMTKFRYYPVTLIFNLDSFS